MTEDKAARYHRLKRRADIAGLLWGAALLLLLSFSGAARGLRIWRAARPAELYATVAVVVLAVVLLHEIPRCRSSVRGFVLERRYDLRVRRPALGARSRQGHRAQRLPDHRRCAHRVRRHGARAAVWWLVSGTVFAFLFVASPIWRRCCCCRSSSLQAARARRAARTSRAARGAPGTRIVGVYEWALGTRTRKANAALAGLGNTRRILVSDTMLDQYSDDEIEVVLAHELGHHVHHDIWRGLALEIGLILLGCFAADWGLRRLGPLVGLDGLADPAGVPLVAAAAGAVSLVLLPFGLALPRRHERRADRSALDLPKNPNAFVPAMRRLGAQNLAEEQPSRIVQWLFHSHPPLEETAGGGMGVAGKSR